MLPPPRQQQAGDDSGDSEIEVVCLFVVDGPRSFQQISVTFCVVSDRGDGDWRQAWVQMHDLDPVRERSDRFQYVASEKKTKTKKH